MSKSKPMWNGIELYAEVPHGWEVVGFRIPREGEWALTKTGATGLYVNLPLHIGDLEPRVILRRKTRTVTYAVARFRLSGGVGELGTARAVLYTACGGSGITTEVLSFETAQEPV